MEFKVQKQEQQMLIHWEQNVGGLQVETSNMEEEDEEQMKDLAINIVLIFDL